MQLSQDLVSIFLKIFFKFTIKRYFSSFVIPFIIGNGKCKKKYKTFFLHLETYFYFTISIDDN